MALAVKGFETRCISLIRKFGDKYFYSIHEPKLKNQHSALLSMVVFLESASLYEEYSDMRQQT